MNPAGVASMPMSDGSSTSMSDGSSTYPGEDLPLVVVDIDGVVADVTHRLYLLDRHPRRWDEFFAAAADDPLLPEGLAMVTGLPEGHRLCWLTGRPERNRTLTAAWLARHGMPNDPLLMRPDRDRRPARQAKRDHLRALRRRHQIALVVDDDPQVIEMLTEEGLPHLLADWLPYSPRLHQAQERQGRT